MMKSIKLNKAMREDILSGIMARYDTANPCPVDIAATEIAAANALWEHFHGGKGLNTIYSGYFSHSYLMRVEVRGQTRDYYYSMEGKDWSKDADLKIKRIGYYESKRLILDELLQEVDAHDAALDTYATWSADRSRFSKQVSEIIYSVSTTKQLVEAWPEVEEYVPMWIKEPSKGIQLPAIRTADINSKLGL